MHSSTNRSAQTSPASEVINRLGGDVNFLISALFRTQDKEAQLKGPTR